jgi:uncharacterized small protein (DUF1192 family)
MAREEDEEPAIRRLTPLDLTPLSIAELEGYIEALQAEILRSRAAIDAKLQHRGGAEGLFKF